MTVGRSPLIAIDEEEPIRGIGNRRGTRDADRPADGNRNKFLSATSQAPSGRVFGRQQHPDQTVIEPDGPRRSNRMYGAAKTRTTSGRPDAACAVPAAAADKRDLDSVCPQAEERARSRPGLADLASDHISPEKRGLAAPLRKA